jgi:epidermal growth factor receptor substrate 15
MVSSPSHAQNPAAVVSPAASTNSQSMNPFFRRTPTAASETAMSPSPFAREGGAPQDQSTYDSVLDPPIILHHRPPGHRRLHLELSLRVRHVRYRPSQLRPANLYVRPKVPTCLRPQHPPPSSYHESSQTAEPPAPPKSRQITSSLPFRENIQRSIQSALP